MCLIYYRDAAKHTAPIDYRALQRAYVENPDGLGVAWYAAGSWHAWRSTDAPWRNLKIRLQALTDAAERIVVHFRWATHGGCDLDNCHPFQVAPQSFLFHNGAFSGVDGENDRSDTRQVAERMAAIVNRGGRILDAWRLVKLLSDGNRLLLTLPGGRIAWVGRWYSRADGCYSNRASFAHRTGNAVADFDRDCQFSEAQFADWYRDFC